MSPLVFSICQSFNETTQNLEEILAPFNARQRPTSQVQLHPLMWEDYRQELTKFATHNQGPDVSQVGAPVVNDMAAMNSLRPFTRRDVIEVGGPETFTQTAWDTTQQASEEYIWSLPWYSDARAIFYWRDMLEDAGIEPHSAFESFDQVEATFAKLQSAGMAAPWSLPTAHKLGTLQSALSWLWGAGGGVVSADGKEPMFAERAALEGLWRYFSLLRYLPADAPLLSMAESLERFTRRQAAATMANLQLARSILRDSPDLAPRLAIALPPGPPYVGGSSLVIWKYSHQEAQAVQLVQHLLSPQAQYDYCRTSGNLPVRRDTLAQPPYTDDPIYNVFVQAVEKGRIFPVFRLSGLVEERLATVLSQVWGELANDPATDLAKLLADFLRPTAGRLRGVLQ